MTSARTAPDRHNPVAMRIRAMWQSDLAWTFRHSPVAMVSFVVVVLLVSGALLAPLIAPHDPFAPATLNLMNGFTAPGAPNAFTGELLARHRRPGP